MTNFFYDLNAKLAAVAGKKQLNEADISRLSPDYVSDKSDMVRFEVYGDEAVDALNDMLGHVIEWDEDDMMVIPREYMPEVQEIVDELGGELHMAESAYPGVAPEHLDELSKDTLKSYAKKASRDAQLRGMDAVAAATNGNPEGMNSQLRKSLKRQGGVRQAIDRLEEASVVIGDPDYDENQAYPFYVDVDDRTSGYRVFNMMNDDSAGRLFRSLEKATAYAEALNAKHKANPKPRRRPPSRGWMGEAAVHTKKYSWGTMKVIQQGADSSIILHPELIDAICALSDGGHTVIRDETNTQYGVMRHGDQLHFKNPRAGVDVVVDRSEICDDEQLGELSKDTLKSYHDKAGKDADKSWGLANAAAQRSNKGRKSDMDQFMKHSERFGKRKAGMDRAASRLNEGTWSLPDSEEKVARLCKILSAPLNAESATHVLYNYLGNDDLFDRLEDEKEYYGREDIPAERQDVRDLVIGWLQQNVDEFPEYQAVLDKLGAEQVNELSKNTLGSYIKKATRDAISKADRAGMKVGFGHDGAADDYMKASKREQGIHRATDRLTESEDMEDLISDLRKAYANVDRVDPASPMYKKLIAFLDGLDAEHLQTLADAGVKFVSMLAKSRLMRKGFDECSMNERAGPVGGGRWQSKMEEDEIGERAGPVNKKDWNRYYKSGKTHNDKTWGQQLHLGEGNKAKPDYLDMDKDGNKSEPMKQAIKQSKLKEADKPDYIDIDNDGNRKEPMKKAAKDAKKTNEAYGRRPPLNPDSFSGGRKIQGSWDREARDFKRAEHEAEWEQEKRSRQASKNADDGPWYINVNGKTLKTGGQPKVFDSAKGARAYIKAMKQRNPDLGNSMLVRQPEDLSPMDFQKRHLKTAGYAANEPGSVAAHYRPGMFNHFYGEKGTKSLEAAYNYFVALSKDPQANPDTRQKSAADAEAMAKELEYRKQKEAPINEGRINELSKDTLRSYGKKAAGEIKGKTMQHGRALDTYSKANSEKKAAALRPGVDNAARKLKNREKGVQQAFDRLEETDQINELSHNTMSNYLAKARREGGAFKTYDKKDSASDSKRDKGAKTAIKKMSKAPLDESESMNKDKIKAYVYDQIMKAINKSGKSNEELMKAVGFCKGCIKEWTKEAKKRG